MRSRSGWPKSRISHAVIMEIAKMKQYATLADVFMMDWVVQLATEQPSQAAMLARHEPAHVATNMAQPSYALDVEVGVVQERDGNGRKLCRYGSTRKHVLMPREDRLPSSPSTKG